MTDISYRATAIAYYIAKGQPLPLGESISKLLDQLITDGDYTLYLCCNTKEVKEAYPDMEKAVALVNPMALTRYRIMGKDYLGVTRFLKDIRTGKFAHVGGLYFNHNIKGGKAPSQPDSPGSVFTIFGDTYEPNTLGLVWQ